MKNHLKFIPFLSLVAILCSCNTQVSFSNLSSSGFEQRHTDAQLAYLNSTDYLDTSPYTGNMSVSAPNPVVLSWEGTSKNVTVGIYKDEALTKLVANYQINNGNSLEFCNGELGTTYYWNVSRQGTISETASFTTDAKGPRNLFVDGVENFRDLGGYGHIKQGLIYRSGRFNESKEAEITPLITEQGLFEVKSFLKIKTEIDLRRVADNEVGGLTNESVLGKDVKYVSLPMQYGGNNILTYKGTVSETEYDNPAKIKAFFELLADQNNYPVNFHCSIGKDRTGCLAFLVEGLLGNSEEQLYRDYMFTNFANAGYCKGTDVSTRYGKTLSEYSDGSNLQEKIYNYLNNEIGVSKENLDSVISILKAE